jgi:hypothetical protein
MIQDWALPPGFTPAVRTVAERDGIAWGAARWTPAELEALARRLVAGGAALRLVPRHRLEAAWGETVAAFLDPRSPERQALDPPLVRLSRLSPPGLAAGLEAVLGGVSGEPARRLFAQAPAAPPPPGLVVVVLASNLPALAVQSLLPALALRRPLLLKSPTGEPLFTPAFVRSLTGREPALAETVAAVSWPGGDDALERPVLAAAARILAYGAAETLEDLERRAPGKLVAYGPKASLAVVGRDADGRQAASGLARDVALFDQRGCLSVQAVYTDGDAAALADELAAALALAATALPPGPLDPVAAALVQQLRAEADLRGLHRPDLPFAAGTVVVEPEPAFRPSPGLRAVRVHRLPALSDLLPHLSAWRGLLQGAALAGDSAWALAEGLEDLGLSRLAAPGELQSAGALWHNGGRHPLTALGGQGGGQGDK